MPRLLDQRLNVLAWLLLGAVFFTELRLPADANVGLLYVVVLLLGLGTPGGSDVLILAALATGLSVAAYAVIAPVGDHTTLILNRVLQIVVVWVTACGVAMHRRALRLRARAERHAVEAEARLREQAALAQVGKMATIVAHEVRNPLAGIRGAMQVMGGRLEPGGREHAVTTEIVARVDALNAVLTDLLRVAYTAGASDEWWDKRESGPASAPRSLVH